MKSGKTLSIRTLFIVMLTVVVIGILIARSYYGNANSSVDPRIREAREMYEKYDNYARGGNYHSIFALLDSIEQIYLSTPHYRTSFELGVLENNRAAALLTIAIYRDSIPQSANPFYNLTPDSIITMAEIHLRNAIELYNLWVELYSAKDVEEIREIIKPDFVDGFGEEEADHIEKYMETRIQEIEDAIHENSRRLSVCYTNLGLVYRNQGAYEEALMQYEKALALWDRNLDAENNLNKLLNRPLKKRNFIQKMFPPDRN